MLWFETAPRMKVHNPHIDPSMCVHDTGEPTLVTVLWNDQVMVLPELAERVKSG